MLKKLLICIFYNNKLKSLIHKKQFMTSVAMVAIVANGMIQTAPAETATEHSEGIQVVQNTSEVVSTGSVEEAKENLI